jgi:GDP-L-fucose synthase
MVTLVTGSDGLVGHALKAMSPENFYFATRSDADLRSETETRSLIEDIRPDKVIHLAALVGGIGGNLMKSADFFRENIAINMNVLEASRKAGVTKLISFMSTCVFPNHGPYPLRPENLHLGPPHPSNFGYAYAKRMLEVQSRAYREQWGMNYQIAIPANIYGPNDNFDLEEGHVVPALIHKAYLASQSKSTLKVWGSGTPLREFIFSEDVAKLTIWMLENYESTEPLILSHGVESSIKELVAHVTHAIDFEGEVVFESDKPDGQHRKPSDVSPLVRLNPGIDFSSLEFGIDKTVKWFLNQYPNIRK